MGIGKIENFAPGLDSTWLGGRQPGGVKLIDDTAQQRIALEDFDLGLDVRSVRRGAAFGGRVTLLHVQEVLIETDDFERSSSLVDGGLRNGNQISDDGSEAREEEKGTLATA